MLVSMEKVVTELKLITNRNISVGQIEKAIRDIDCGIDKKNLVEQLSEVDIKIIKEAHSKGLGSIRIKKMYFPKKNLTIGQIYYQIQQICYGVDPEKLEDFTEEDIKNIAIAHFDGKGPIGIKRLLFLNRNISLKQIQYQKDKISFPVDPDNLEELTEKDIKKIIEAHCDENGAYFIKKNFFLKRNISLSQIDHQIRLFHYGVDPEKLEDFNEDDLEKIADAHFKGEGSIAIKKLFFLDRNISIAQIDYQIRQIKYGVDTEKLEEFTEDDLEKIADAHFKGDGSIRIKKLLFLDRNISIGQIYYQILQIKKKQ